MLDTAFFMTMGGLGVSFSGFGGLFPALHHDDRGMEPAVCRWRMREIMCATIGATGSATGAYAVEDEI